MAVALIVALRLTVGWHFFYEGVWKVDERNEFTAKPFLTQAKGPAAPLFYAMIPDLDGTERLKLRETTAEEGVVTKMTKEEEREWIEYAASEEGKAEGFVRPERKYFPATGFACRCADGCVCATETCLCQGEDGCICEPPPWYTSDVYEEAWADFKAEFDKAYPREGIEKKKIDLAYRQYLIALREYLTNNQAEIEGYIGSLARHREYVAAGTNLASHQKKRNWEEMMKLRGEAKGFIAELDGMTTEMQAALYREADIAAGERMPQIVLSTHQLPVAVPGIASQTEWLNLSVTWGLTAIGLCLMLGLCSRLAALGGAAFLMSVLLTQPPWPPIYPPAPEVVGHAMIVDKNFVEMVALLMLVVIPAGRWAGLDYFLYKMLGEKVERKYQQKLDEPTTGHGPHGVPEPKSAGVGAGAAKK